METLLRSAKFDVVRKPIRGRDGTLRQRDVVVHPGAVVILPILSDGRIVLIHQMRHTIDRLIQELPAGTLDVPGESPEAAAARELEEEAGYRAGRIEKLCEFYPSPGVMTELIRAYVATELVRTEPRPGPTEEIEVELVTLSEAVERIRRGQIVDAKTLIALLHYRLLHGGAA